jgi:hypothetical protein
MINLTSNTFPKFSDYAQTEEGWNRYDNDWVTRRRMTPNIADIPKDVLEEHWASLALGREKGWQEQE